MINRSFFLVCTFLVCGCGNKSQEKNVYFNSNESYVVQEKDTFKAEFNSKDFSNKIFKTWDYGKKYRLVDEGDLNEYQRGQLNSNPLFPYWQFAYQDFNNDEKNDVAIIVKDRKDGTNRVLLFEKEKVGYSRAKIYDTPSDFLAFIPVTTTSLVSENDFVVIGKSPNEHLYHAYRFDSWHIFNEQIHIRRKHNRLHNKESKKYLSDGTKCLHCKQGIYRFGVCNLCGTVSKEKARDSYKKLPKCFLCKGTRIEKNPRNPNEFRVCPACKGRGVIIH